MQFEKRSISDLDNDPANVRQHNDQSIAAIKASLRRFGQQKPIVVNSDGTVIAGNGTLQAATELGWDEIGVVVSDLDTVSQTAYAIADNRTGDFSSFDNQALALQLQALAEQDLDLLSDVSYSQDFIDRMLETQSREELDYSILDDDDDETDDAVDQFEQSNRKSLAFDFSLEDYDEVYDLCARFRKTGIDIGKIVLGALKDAAGSIV